MRNTIAFKNKFVNLENVGENNYQLAMSVTSELMQFGFLLDQSAISNLTNASKESIVTFHNEVISYLKEITGSKRTHKPFWSGFPTQVMEMSECELWVHQILHYISNGTYVPSEFTESRKVAFEQPNYTIITACDNDRFLQIFTDLVSVNNSLTPTDLDIVKWFVNSGLELRMPAVIPFKENLCTLASMGLDVPVRTTTDVLRIAVGMSGGDVSLPKVPQPMVKVNSWSSTKVVNKERENFKFKKFTRKERKFILSLLEKTNCDSSEAVLKDQRWIRLGEILHPGEFKTKFPKSFKMFSEIRNGLASSWYSKVEKSFDQSFEKGLKTLSERPGEFLRKLDSLVRNNPDKETTILEHLSKVAPKVSNKVLFESIGHFEGRSKRRDRYIKIKGRRSNLKLDSLDTLSPDLITSIQSNILDGLKGKFSELPELGNVCLDEELKKIPLPTNMRSMNESLKPIIRGQRVPMGNQNMKVVRAFVHWFDEHGYRDIDLTATFLGMGKVKHIGWNGDHNTIEGCYSGDVRHRQGACAEYIDINIEESLKRGYKYVIMDARNYNGGSLSDITDCVFGWMEREFPEENEVFVPSTLANTVRLNSPSSNTIVAMIDLETQEYIFLDIDQSGIPVASANFDSIMDAVKPYTELPKFSVYDLLKLHAESRGKVVSKDEADKHFIFDEFSSSYVEILKWMGV